MDEPFIGEMIMVAFDYAPKGWASCNGQLLSISQNQALFSLLGTTYGGNGVTTFALPDLRSRVPIGFGNGAGLPSYSLGEAAGVENVTLLSANLPAHNHILRADATTAASSNFNVAAAGRSLGNSTGLTSAGATFAENVYDTATPAVAMASGTLANAGGSQPHPNIQPYLAVNWVIALVGVYPSRN